MPQLIHPHGLSSARRSGGDVGDVGREFRDSGSF
jgi:hypothetical protein